MDIDKSAEHEYEGRDVSGHDPERTALNWPTGEVLFKRFWHALVALLIAELAVSLIFSIVLSTLKNSRLYSGYFGEDNIWSAFLSIDYSRAFLIFITLAIGGVLVATLSAIVASSLPLDKFLYRVVSAITGPILSIGFGGWILGLTMISEVDEFSRTLFFALVIFAAVVFYGALSILASCKKSGIEKGSEKDSKS